MHLDTSSSANQRSFGMGRDPNDSFTVEIEHNIRTIPILDP